MRFFLFFFFPEDTKCSCLHAQYHWKSNNDRRKTGFFLFPPRRFAVHWVCSRRIHIAACGGSPCLHTQVDPLHNTHDQCTMGTRHFTLISWTVAVIPVTRTRSGIRVSSKKINKGGGIREEGGWGVPGPCPRLCPGTAGESRPGRFSRLRWSL